MILQGFTLQRNCGARNCLAGLTGNIWSCEDGRAAYHASIPGFPHIKQKATTSALAWQRRGWNDMLKHVKSLFPLGAHAHVATLTSMWRPLSSSQYGTSASHGAKPRITSCTCLFLSDSGSSQALQKDFKVKIQTFWTQLQIDSVHVFITHFFLAQKWLILWSITAKTDQKNAKWLYSTRDLLFFLSWLHLIFSVAFSSL